MQDKQPDNKSKELEIWKLNQTITSENKRIFFIQKGRGKEITILLVNEEPLEIKVLSPHPEGTAEKMIPLSKVIEIVEKVKQVNESNGRYNACEEILNKLKDL